MLTAQSHCPALVAQCALFVHVPVLVSNVYTLTTISVAASVAIVVAMIVAIVAIVAGQRIAVPSQRSMPKRCDDNKSCA